MLKSGELSEYRRVIEETLTAMRRADVGVGDIAEKGGRTLAVAFSRRGHDRTVEVPIDDLRGKEQARATISRAILGLTKAIEKETMETRLTIVRCRFDSAGM